MAARQQSVPGYGVDHPSMAVDAGLDDEIDSGQARADQGNRLVGRNSREGVRAPRVGDISGELGGPLNSGRIVGLSVAKREDGAVCLELHAAGRRQAVAAPSPHGGRDRSHRHG